MEYQTDRSNNEISDIAKGPSVKCNSIKKRKSMTIFYGKPEGTNPKDYVYLEMTESMFSEFTFKGEGGGGLLRKINGLHIF